MRTPYFRSVVVAATTILIAQFAIASTDTIGTNGINSAGLKDFNNQPLNGIGISIGQVDLGRAAKKNDPDTDPSVYNPFVTPFKVFDRAGLTANQLGPGTIAGPESEAVASVMVSTDTNVEPGFFAPTGVSTAANLLSIASHPQTVSDNLQDQFAVSSQTIVSFAKNNPTQVDPLRAINMSIGVPITPPFDGNSTLTEYVDWSALNDNILYVIAGNEFDDATNAPKVGVPADNFNGMTIGRAKKDANGVYTLVSPKNDYQTTLPANRAWISLIAPGDDVDVDEPGFNQATGNGNQGTGNGTSFAAPHVVGTVALLQQYGKQRQAASTPNWSTPSSDPNPDYARHQVMKAVLMNSADKIHLQSDLPAGMLTVPAGGFLDQDRTVLRTDGGNWFSTLAADKSSAQHGGFIPTDDQFGAGELDAKRALTQFAAGEYHSLEVSNKEVPVIGWDYSPHVATAFGQLNHYIYRLNQALPAGSFISITLTFDRTVQFDTGGSGGQYHSGDTFVASVNTEDPGQDQVNDYDLFLFHKGSGNSNGTGRLAVSSTPIGDVEHIFFQIPTTGEYEFWVAQSSQDLFTQANYAVAWWALGTGALTSGVGDVNQDGHVNAGDVKTMMDALANESSVAQAEGITTDELSLVGDVNGDGQFTNADLQSLLNLLKSGGGSTSVPEPASLVLLAIGGLALLRRRLTSTPAVVH